MTSEVGGQIEFEHYHRYCFARDFCQDKDVLDVASGEGYGSMLLSAVARSVVGIDVSLDAVRHSNNNYKSENLNFIHGDAAHLPTKDASVDVIISFETLEHVAQQDIFFSEVRRVLRPDGLFVVSTPDRAVYSADAAEPNPYHINELTYSEFKTLIGEYFTKFSLLRQRPIIGSILTADDASSLRSYERRGDDFIEATEGLARAHYLVAVATNHELPAITSSTYIDRLRVHDVVQERLTFSARTAALQAQHAAVLEQAATIAGERDAAYARLAQVNDRKQEFEQLVGRLESESALARKLEDLLRESYKFQADACEHAATTTKTVDNLQTTIAHAQRLHDAVLQDRTAADELMVLRAELANAARERDEARVALARFSTKGNSTKKIFREEAPAAPPRPENFHDLKTALAQCELFDPQWYKQKAQLNTDDRGDLASHYLETGWRSGLQPHPLFDCGYYLESNKDIADAGVEPLMHYINVGWKEGRRPHPLFDSAFYLMSDKGGSAKGTNPLLHYINIGAREGRDPHPLFNAVGYAMDNRGFPADGNALRHYLTRGHRGGPYPHPLFDGDFYLEVHHDVRLSGIDPFVHYVQHGDTEGRQFSKSSHEGQRLSESPLEMPFSLEVTTVVIIPVYCSYGDTFRCLASIAASAPDDGSMRVVIADDCPNRSVEPLFAHVPNLSIIQHPRNLGFLQSCNRAAALTESEFILFLNNDTKVRRGWIEAMVRIARRDPGVAMVGCKLLNTDATVQEAGGVMFTNGWGHPYGRNDTADKPEYNFVREVDCVIGACFLVRRSHFDEVGGLDEKYSPAFFEEFDLAAAFIDRGYKVIYQPASEVFHVGSASYGAEMRDRQTERNHSQFIEKWATQLSTRFEGESDIFLARERVHKSGVIVVVDDSVPEYDKHAGSLTLYQYLGLLRNLDFKVVFYPHNNQHPNKYCLELQQMGIEIVYDDLYNWLQENGKYVAFVWLARPDIAKYYVSIMRSRTKARIVYYTHDLHHVREIKRFEIEGDMSALKESKRVGAIEQAIFRSIDTVMSPSAKEALIIEALAPRTPVCVLPPYFFGSANTPEAWVATPVEKRRSIIFVGGYNHLPNVDAANILVNEIMPRVWRKVPDAKLLLLGSNPPEKIKKMQSEKVDVVGFVEDLSPWYARARMSVSPLRWGAGVKGKIIESMMFGVPVVTTPIGNEGIDLRSGHEALIAETSEDLAAQVIALFASDDLTRSLADTGARLVAERFSERAARQKLLEALDLEICNVCGMRFPTPPPSETLNWREEPFCRKCWSLNRMSAVADVLIEPYRKHGCTSVDDTLPYLRGFRIHEFGFVGPIHDRLKTLPAFSCSDFFDDTEPGKRSESGIRCEDICNLTFEDETFDLTLSQEVLEHVPNPRRAFAEIYRTLKRGGRHIMSVPYNPNLEHTVTRCEIRDGALHHFLPPEFHGDPLRSEGALVFTDYGHDLIEMLERTGFVVDVSETHEQMPGGYIAIFDCRRPG